MSAPSHVPTGTSTAEFQQWVSEGFVKPIPLAIAFFLVVLTGWMSLGDSQSHLKSVPLANPPKSILQTTAEIKSEFLHSAGDVVNRARTLYRGKPFRMITNLGQVVLLPSQFAHEIRNSPQLDFMAAVFQDFHGTIPGFQGLSSGAKGDGLLIRVARKALTKSLAKVTEPLADEASRALVVNLGESTEWKAVNLQKAMIDVISRVSSRVFLNEEMCRNEDWLRVTKVYTAMSFKEAAKMTVVPRMLRPLVHWFMPSIRQLRALCAEAKALIGPVIEKRRRLKAEAVARGEPVPQFDDCIEWAEAEANGPYDPAIFQLNISVAAIHTTTDLTTRVLLDLADRPEVIADLRAEVIAVLRAEGWKKTALYNMKLLDSAIKESQRLKPISSVTMRRVAMGPVKLSNGIELRRGDRLQIDHWPAMKDAAIHANPEEYDARRFLRWREQSGLENKAHLVSTSPEHLAFGHGEHACPGRFFAANEIKIVLCHLLLQYDWKLAPGTDKAPRALGFSLNIDPSTQMLFRRRANPELDIDSI